jgi:hypothetical protein
MAEDLRDDLEQRMAQAVADEDFELAARLRDQIGSRLRRQVPGRMGLGTDQQVYTPPEGWTPPARPDFLTANRRRRRGKPT